MRLCVCVFCGSLCGTLANGISLIRSINSFYFFDFFPPLSLDAIHLDTEFNGDTRQCTEDW